MDDWYTLAQNIGESDELYDARNQSDFWLGEVGALLDDLLTTPRPMTNICAAQQHTMIGRRHQLKASTALLDIPESTPHKEARLLEIRVGTKSRNEVDERRNIQKL